MKPYDLIVVLRLLLADQQERERPTAWLASELGLSTSRIHEFLGRLRAARLVDPLHKLVPRIAESDPRMYELLALVDGVRLGDARIRKEAIPALKERLMVPVARRSESC